MKNRLSICVAVLLLVSAAGCGSAGNSRGSFDNTGGAPPPGNAIGFRSIWNSAFSIDVTCTPPPALPRSPVLVRAVTDIPVVISSCSSGLRTALTDAIAALTADQAIGIFSVNLGGCVRSFEIARVNRDGLVIRPWILLHDTTLGAGSPVACTADAISNITALVFDGAAGANALELHLARINPNYPRNPDVPVF